MVRYKMVARDFNSNPTQYRTWIVQDTPDFDGYFYTGYKSGPNDFTEVSAYAINDNSVIADFNLPIPTSWFAIDNRLNVSYPIRKVLPEQMSAGKLVILDGYAYIFGGETTDAILRASVNNPADWVDTGAKLPSILYGAALAIVNGRIYLFGGNNGNESDPMGLGVLDTIYSASVTDPLTWTNHGSHLPRRLQYSNLGMANGNLYLFGGIEINEASDVILTAPVSNPLAWTNTGAHLPMPTYASMFAEIGGNWMIFGGLLAPDTPTNAIYSAPVSNPTAWQITGVLPYPAAHGQFVAIGNDGYIIAPMSNPVPTTTYTPIVQCSLSNPNAWIYVQQVVPGNISHCQMAIIYDRIWLFGGSGLTAIFACNQKLKYKFTSLHAINYGNATRTVVPATDNLNNPLLALSMPWWLTDYKFPSRP
jgi:hypothetical protein